MSIENGTNLGHYQILGPLGAGGMGEVYRAQDTRLKREVAVKILPSHVANNPDSLSRFEREAMALAQLSHPNILAIHDFGRYAGVTLAATELLNGETLRVRIERGPIPTRRVLEIAANIAEGLAAAHSKGIVHRDLKPENVFITSDDQVKILDFGLARVEGAGTRTDGTETSIPTETDPSIVKGTIGYMAPEQLRGQHTDGRGDIFSLGCLLYEMLTGQRTFARDTVADTMSAILHEDPTDFAQSGRQIPADVERVTLQCLEKHPGERFQSARDLAVHLRTLVSSTDISSPGLRRTSGGMRWLIWALPLALIVVLAVAALFMTLMTPGPGTLTERPSVAVLYFENNTGDASLNWLRSALANMLVTDLSQSTQIEVLGTDRLYQVLKELGQLEAPTVSSEVIEELARQAGVTTVVLGSFVKAGDSFRLSTRVQEAESGRILATERVEGVGESAIFQMVDELTKRIKTTLEVSVPSDEAFERGIEEVTSSSVEAFRYYADGERLHGESKDAEAIPLFEKALEIDPDFAMALAKLSVAHWNVGHVAESYDYAKRALERVDRLTARERYYIEGRFYSLNPSTIGQAIDAYERAITLYPDHGAARHNLANIYQSQERYSEAISHFEELRGRGSGFGGTYTNLATCYAQIGRTEEGLRVLNEFVEKHPDNAAGHRDLGMFLVSLGRFDEARSELQRAEVLGSQDLAVLRGYWLIALLEDDLVQAEREARRIAVSEDPHWKYESIMMRSLVGLYRGNAEEALDLLEEAGEIFPEPGPARSNTLFQISLLEFDRGDPLEALAAAEAALEAGRGYGNEQGGQALVALAQAKLGRSEEARSSFDAFVTSMQDMPEKIVSREENFIAGCVALQQGQSQEAVTKLSRAEAGLPDPLFAEKGGVLLLFHLGVAYWEAGDREEAALRFQRIIDAELPRAMQPIPYVRSFYFLGSYYKEKGDHEKARENFERFLSYWKDGSLDRGRVAEATAFLGS